MVLAAASNHTFKHQISLFPTLLILDLLASSSTYSFNSTCFLKLHLLVQSLLAPPSRQDLYPGSPPRTLFLKKKGSKI